VNVLADVKVGWLPRVVVVTFLSDTHNIRSVATQPAKTPVKKLHLNTSATRSSKAHVQALSLPTLCHVSFKMVVVVVADELPEIDPTEPLCPVPEEETRKRKRGLFDAQVIIQCDNCVPNEGQELRHCAL